MLVKVNIDGLGIITGEQKSLLEAFVKNLLFKQRKQYDEYYLKSGQGPATMSIEDVLKLAQEFTVLIECGCVRLEH